MTIKPDFWIEKMALEEEMIKPFSKNRVVKSEISSGLSAYGYDISLADEFKILKKDLELVDPKLIKDSDFISKKSDSYILPPTYG